MSVSRECRIVENEPGSWFLLLALREHGTLSEGPAYAYGPFPSDLKAIEYLDEFSNPGGFNVEYFEPGQPVRGLYQRLISQAIPPFSDRQPLVVFRPTWRW